jgi:hypothetical protein
MREFGLILENVDGLEDPTRKFVMRGVPHTLALANSLTQPTNLAGAPEEMTGWSGDGSPGGTLRDFATGAVTQHFTRSLLRRPGVDFRLPTSDELDAMEAFQLALGRQTDLNLATLVLANSVAAAGQAIFQDGTSGGDNTLPGGKCSTCHFNAGALNANGENRNFNTGVEDRPNSPTVIAGMPRDGGFGATENDEDSFGDGSFNSTPLVEAADTGPFFHNDSARTLEEAVTHYTTDAFNSSRGIGGQIAMTRTQIQAVAAFLRVINAVENDRSAVQYAQLATRAVFLRQAQRPLSLAVAELTDALQVLAEQRLHPDAAEFLQRARRLLEQARITDAQFQRNFLIRSAIDAAQQARGLMVTSG